jgi:L-lactate permease
LNNLPIGSNSPSVIDSIISVQIIVFFLKLPLNSEVVTGRNLHDVKSSWTLNNDGVQTFPVLVEHKSDNSDCRTTFCKYKHTCIITISNEWGKDCDL